MSRFQTCYQGKTPTRRTQIHSDDMANSIFTGELWILDLLQVFIAFNVNIYNFLKLKQEEIWKYPSSTHYLYSKMALDIIWNNGKLLLQGCNISLLGLLFSRRFAILGKKKKRDLRTQPMNETKLIQFKVRFKVCVWSMWNIWMRAEFLFQIPLFPLSSTNFKTYQ